jgi:phosphonate transport system permease protein
MSTQVLERDTLRGGSSPAAVRLTIWAVPALALVSWGWLLAGSAGQGAGGFGPDTLRRVGAFLGALLGLQTEISPTGNAESFLSGARWWEMAVLAYETVSMSVLAIWISVAGMMLTVMIGARAHAEEGATPSRLIRGAAFWIVRTLWVVARGVPELVWALLIVLVVQPGLFAGALALGIHNFGILGKLCAEVVEHLDPGPSRALRAGGAGSAQVLTYAVLPQALPQFLTFALYRWEVVIRTTIVVGFVSAGGLGREFRLAMSFFHYTDVAMILATYFVLVLLVVAASGKLRALARA